MAIRMMTTKADFEANPADIEVVLDYPGHPDPLYMKTTHKGLVLQTWEHNGRDDSDFFATVWDWERKAPKDIEFASTRGWTYPNNAVVDATDDVWTAFDAWAAEQLRIKTERKCHQAEKIVAVGKDAEVVKGRKVPLGTRGRVFWIGPSEYGARAGIELVSGERIFVALANLEGRVQEVSHEVG